MWAWARHRVAEGDLTSAAVLAVLVLAGFLVMRHRRASDPSPPIGLTYIAYLLLTAYEWPWYAVWGDPARPLLAGPDHLGRPARVSGTVPPSWPPSPAWQISHIARPDGSYRSAALSGSPTACRSSSLGLTAVVIAVAIMRWHSTGQPDHDIAHDLTGST